MLEIGRIPVRFDRVLAAAFESDEVARVRLCESSGSEHSAESSTDLSDLVKSFMEREEDDAVVVVHDDNDNDDREFDYSEKREILEEIFANNYSLDDAKENIRREVQLAFGVVAGDKSEPGFKRLFVSRLRERGFDAG